MPNIQNELYEKTNLIKKLEPEIKKINNKKFLSIAGLVPTLVLGGVFSALTNSPTSLGLTAFLSLGFMASTAYFHIKESQLKSRLLQTHARIFDLRELEMVANLHTDNHVIRQFKRV